jgi:hypothetical protein
MTKVSEKKKHLLIIILLYFLAVSTNQETSSLLFASVHELISQLTKDLRTAKNFHVTFSNCAYYSMVSFIVCSLTNKSLLHFSYFGNIEILEPSLHL